MGHILNTAAKRRAISAPSTLTPQQLAIRRFRIRRDIDNIVEDLKVIVENDDGPIKDYALKKIRPCLASVYDGHEDDVQTSGSREDYESVELTQEELDECLK